MATVAKSPTVTPINNAATRPPIIQPASNLWEKALQALDEEDRANVNFNTNKLDVLEDILAAAAEKQQLCLEKRWKYKKGNKVIIIRDQLEKIVGWVDKFKQVGDQIVQYDPGHAALPWAGVRFFLQWTVNDTQMFGAMAEGMEFVSGLITRYAIFEKLYSRSSAESPTKAEVEEQLNEALCKLYAAVLRYLSKAKRYYTRTAAERLLHAAKDEQSNLDRYISKISKAKTDVDDCAQLIDSAQRHTIIDEAQNLKILLLQLNSPINRSAVLLSDIHDSLKESERRDMFKWLSTTQYATHHKTMGKDFLPGSGNWLLQKKEFVEWRKESSSSILWLHGIPGSGKSKLIYSVIEHLSKERSKNRSPAPMGYLYCVRSTSEPERADPDEIMRSILKQLSCSTSAVAVREPVAAKYKELKKEADDTGCDEPSKLTITECDEPSKLTITECEELILELLRSNPATIIIDALDECDPARRHELLQVLDNFIQESSNVVKIFVSSRNDNDIVCRLENSSNVVISADDNDKDIQRFIVSEVDQSIKNKRLLSGRVSDELKKQIINVLTEGAQGMFRWVSLQLQNICDPQRMKHEKDVMAELGKLPKTLNESYQVIYDRIVNTGETSQQIADRALKWLLCSKRPLSPQELIAAVTINPDGGYVPLNESELLDICCNLLVLDEELKRFRFVHLSVREYLEHLKNFNNIEANTLVLQRCLDVHIFEHQYQSDLVMKQNNILEPYATSYWPFHCQDLRSNPEDKVKNYLKKFLIQDFDLAPSFQKWLIHLEAAFMPLGHLDPSDHLVSSCLSSPPSALFLTCCFGLSWLMQDLNQLENVFWNQLNKYGHSGLSIAIKQDNMEIVQLLLERDDVDVKIICYRSNQGLIWTAKHGHESMMRLLLEHEDIDANGKDLRRRTPLLHAAIYGHDAVVRLLLERDEVDLNSKDVYDRTPLAYAAKNGHEAAVRLLLERDDVDVNSKDINGRTSLTYAALRGHEAIVRLLLERDDVVADSRDNMCQTPLSSAANMGYEAIVRLLLERDDVDLNSTDIGGRTSLMYAAWHGHEAVVRLLLERDDVDLNSTEIGGRTSLTYAAWYGHEAVVRLLLERDEVAVNVTDYEHYTPLARAMTSGHEAVVRLLLDRDDVVIDDCQDENGVTLRDRAERLGYTEIVRMFDLKSSTVRK